MCATEKALLNHRCAHALAGGRRPRGGAAAATGLSGDAAGMRRSDPCADSSADHCHDSTAGGTGFSDVLGELLSWTDVVRVQRRDGVVVEVPAAQVVAAKKIPPAPERRR